MTPDPTCDLWSTAGLMWPSQARSRRDLVAFG
eukprot:CAMPEP_0182534454 /NCGR_PEP_ID=MMETSP1323-20130603/15808_1 /TAXON_ID=236787 /ORGANISM="Florenciella parvula, Strain RCC1693" /LENGTH=31 /DNA_ID= /DNA_START= /DNA_END= /DNA_ORIENTATION=